MGALLVLLPRDLNPAATAYVSTPNVLTLAPEGAERSGNPWHVHEYRVDEYREPCASAASTSVELLGLFHARKLRAVRSLALRLWLGLVSTPRIGLTKPFYDRFTPAISASDFTLLRRPARSARSTSSRSCR